MANLHGTLVSLSQTNLGSAFDTAASSGATTLSLYDVSDFDEDGGFVSIAGTVYTYDSVDMVADSIHLTSGLTGAQAVDIAVTLWDADTSAFVTERNALLIVDGQPDGDPIEADVDHALHSLLSQTTQAAGQSVSLAEDGDGYRVVAVHGKNNVGNQTTSAANLQYGVDTTGTGQSSGLVVVLSNGSVRLSTLTDVRVKTPDNTTFLPILASAFTVSSDAKVKTKPTNAPDALSIIRDAPAKHWRYLTDDKPVKRLGPIVNFLPEWMQQTIEGQEGEEDHLGVDAVRLIGVLWAAFGQQLAINDELRARIEKLEK